ncbi:MAG: dTDP-4-dehydrorhamnose 3,5-epimerase [bacterium]
MSVLPPHASGVRVIEPRVFADARGYFFESWNEAQYRAEGITERFVQDNVSRSERGVLRGLHFQSPGEQGKLVTVLVGAAFDVAVDIRRGSPTYGKWVGIHLDDDTHRQVYIPAGFAHGFQVTSEFAILSYKCSDYYQQVREATIAWNDPDLAVDWPIGEPILSPKDTHGVLLRDLPAERQPVFR